MGRHKPGKPRRDRPAGDPHAHDDFAVPADTPDPSGRPVDYPLLGKVVGAAMDGCASCQAGLLPLLGEDAVTTARLVEIACGVVHGTLGGLPDMMLEPGDAPGQVAPEFRCLARAGLDGANDALYTTAGQLTPGQRGKAVSEALDLLVGHLSLSGG
jgi:hypothetical protein